MRKKKNPTVEFDGEEIEFDSAEFDPAHFAPWYRQLMQLDEKRRKEIAQEALKRIRASKPDTYRFIVDMKCKLVGICPAVEYTLLTKDEGDLDVTFSHAFGIPTLVYWVPRGKFAILVNANLEYNDTVLNKIKGNKKESIRGFTG